MTGVHIENMDLNLLKGLDLLLDERHVSRAAERARVTQSAMSRTLARLRVVCEDELLVRTLAGYELTPRALALRDELAVVMPALRGMFEDTAFDPRTAAGAMRIAASDYPIALLGDELLPGLHREAPDMSFVITPMLPSTFDDLDRGRIDLVLTPIAAPAHLERQTLFSEDFVCALSATHPLAADRLTVQDLASYPHASVGGLHPQQTIVMDQLDQVGAQIALRVPYFSAAVAAVRGTDLIAVLPRRFATRYADATLRIAEAPEEISGFTYSMLWHARLTNDQAHRWLRSQVMAAAESSILSADSRGAPAHASADATPK